jgi:hypothetical protein
MKCDSKQSQGWRVRIETKIIPVLRPAQCVALKIPNTVLIGEMNIFDPAAAKYSIQ